MGLLFYSFIGLYFGFTRLHNSYVCGSQIQQKRTKTNVQKGKANKESDEKLGLTNSVQKTNDSSIGFTRNDNLSLFPHRMLKKGSRKDFSSRAIYSPCFNINLAKGVIWHPIYSGYDYPGFDTLGNYYENGIIKAKYTWDGCSIVSVSSQTNSAYNFNFGISKLTTDSLWVETARFGVKNFYK